ncbi:uncharacterized protein LOC132561050 [Ylistrum balloti]|uniref:uncharacterized protein LOC132561050 n=1 Tax=Ylistrum balloti TaxID=509963 RepID=UPI002905F1B0|nr:uncharacterized protein LOC132561050 [Ylistrum balloti]
MSGDGTVPPNVFLQPQTTIGAQDLLMLGVKYYGFIRKRGQLERTLESLPVIKLIITKWRQKFAVISKGCLYVYNDEFSTSPFQSVSLRGYDHVVREKENYSERMKSFKLYSKEQPGRKQFIFGSATDGDRKKWMKSLKEEMMLANEAEDEDDDSESGLGPTGDDEPEDEYTYLEKQVKIKVYPPVIPPRPQASKPKTNRKLPEPGFDQESDDSDYDKIAEGELSIIRGRPPLPEIPKDEQKTTKDHLSQKPKAAKPLPAAKPNLRRQVSKDDFMFDSSDRVQVETILSKKTQGTYLVRKSRSNDNEVLSVQTVDGMKEFKIFRKDGQYSIDHKNSFKTLERLVEHYSKEKLPNRPESLSRGYSCTDLSVPM